MKFRIPLLVLSLAAPLAHAQLPAVASEDTQILRVFFRGLDYVEASSLESMGDKSGGRKISSNDVAAARKALEQSLDLARQNSSLKKDAADQSGKTARDAWGSSVNQIRAAAEVAAKLPATGYRPVSPFGSGSSNKAKWPLSPQVIGYRVDAPVVLGYSKVKVDSLTIYGSPSLVDYLFRSRFLDCGPPFPSESSCKLTLLEDKQIPPDARQGSRVKLLLNNARDFAEMYDSFRLSQRSIQQEEKPRDRAQTSTPKESATGERKSPACEAEVKVCLSPNSASMVLGCEGKGEVEIDTNGQISFTMSVGAIAPNEHAAN